MKRFATLLASVSLMSFAFAQTAPLSPPQPTVISKPAPTEATPERPTTMTLPSGVKVLITKKGPTLQTPNPASTVQVHYKGTLENGFEFDSSWRRGKPAQFPLQGVIPCWTQALSQLPVGSSATVTCPAATAYGTKGIPGVIPPGATLIFEIELLSVVR